MRRGWRGPRSLLGQIGLVHLVTILLIALALPVVIAIVLRQTAEHFQDERLAAQASVLRRRLAREDGGWRARLDPVHTAIYRTGYDGRAFLLLDAAGQVLIASPTAPATLAAATPRRDRPERFGIGPVRALSVPVGTAADRAWLVVAQDIDDPGVVTDDVIRASLSRFLWPLLPILALLPAANLLLVWRSTRTVRAVSLRAAEIDPGNLGVRLPAAALPSEVAPLAVATNHALDRLELGFRHQSEFVADVAHELRTPLTTLRLKLDAVADPAQAASMRRTLDEASHVIGQLLDLASLEQTVLAADERFDVAALAAQVIEEVAPAVYAGGRAIGLAAPAAPVLVRGRAPLVGLVLNNLIDNALRHTPEGTRIAVAVEPSGRVAVEDDGPGVGAELAAVVRRGGRGPRTRGEGTGIGLSIVERILTVHGAMLGVGTSREGGARFDFALPPAVP